MSELSAPSASMLLQLRVVLRGISPMIWRRLLVRSDATIADLHANQPVRARPVRTHLHG